MALQGVSKKKWKYREIHSPNTKTKDRLFYKIINDISLSLHIIIQKDFFLYVWYGAGVVIRVLQILGIDAEKIKLSASSIGK